MDKIFVNEPREENSQEVPVTTQCEKIAESAVKERRKKPVSARPSDGEVKGKYPVSARPSPSNNEVKEKRQKEEEEIDSLDQWMCELELKGRGSKTLRSKPLGSKPLGSKPLGYKPLTSKPLGSKPLTSGQDVLETEKTTKIADAKPLVKECTSKPLEQPIDMKDLKNSYLVSEENLYKVLKTLAAVNLSAFDADNYKMVNTITVDDFFSCWQELEKISYSRKFYHEQAAVVKALTRCIEDQSDEFLFGKFKNMSPEKYRLKQDQFKEECSMVMMNKVVWCIREKSSAAGIRKCRTGKKYH